jgi:hypothetical protein
MNNQTFLSAVNIPRVNFVFKKNESTRRWLQFLLVINDVETEIDILSRYSNLRLEVRQRMTAESKLLRTYTFPNGGMQLLNSSTLQINFDKFQDVDGGVVFYDLFASENGLEKCLFQGEISLINNVTI